MKRRTSACMAVTMLCLVAATSAQASFSGRNGKIAFLATAPVRFRPPPGRAGTWDL